MKKNIIIGILAVVVLAGLAIWFVFFRAEQDVTISVSSFEECVEAEYLVMESYPRQCRTPDGKTYVEKISEKITYVNASDNLIKVETPLPNAVVGKNFSVTGQARGTWFFEASFPIVLFDKDGNVLLQAIAQAQSDWMTENFVPFKVDIKIPNSYVGLATLVFKKDNPSGLAKYDASISYSININNVEQKTMPIQLYYYNPALDQGPGGVECSKNGLVRVNRTITKTTAPLTEAIKLLLRGEISTAEKAQGITSEFPLDGLTLAGASIKDGVATLTFNDSQNKTVGGSCRVAILWAQIEATAKQFGTVKSVRFMPEELFQP